MSRYIGERVRVVAKIVKVNAPTAMVELSDGGQIEVKLSSDSHMGGPYVEIIGQVENEKSLKMFKAINLGDNIDMAVVNHTIELMHTPVMSQYWSTKP